MGKKADLQEVLRTIDPTVDPIIESEAMTSEEALGKIALELTKPRDPDFATELDDNQIKMVTALDVIAEQTNNKVLAKFTAKFKKLQISKDRKSRAEIIDIAKGIQEKEAKKLARIREMLGRL